MREVHREEKVREVVREVVSIIIIISTSICSIISSISISIYVCFAPCMQKQRKKTLLSPQSGTRPAPFLEIGNPGALTRWSQGATRLRLRLTTTRSSSYGFLSSAMIFYDLGTFSLTPPSDRAEQLLSKVVTYAKPVDIRNCFRSNFGTILYPLSFASPITFASRVANLASTTMATIDLSLIHI